MTQPPALTPSPRTRRDGPTRGARRALLGAAVLLGLGWVAVVPLLALRAVLETAPFLGEQPDAADRLAQHHAVAVALGVSAALVLAGLLLSVRARSTAASTAFAVLVLPTLVLGLAWLGTAPAPAHPVPAPSASVSHPAACQEHSGGGTRCPGG